MNIFVQNLAFKMICSFSLNIVQFVIFGKICLNNFRNIHLYVLQIHGLKKEKIKSNF